MRKTDIIRVVYLSTLLIGVSLQPACTQASSDSSLPELVQFEQVRDEILLRSCTFSDCHSDGAGELRMDEEGLYEAIVDVPATVEGEVLVRPFDSDGSYLIMKLEGALGIDGDQMPPNAPISQATIDDIRSWIDAGAEP
jgi:hypothetical protein